MPDLNPLNVGDDTRTRAEAPYAIGDRVRYVGPKFSLCGPHGNPYHPETWPSLNPGDVGIVTEIHTGWVEWNHEDQEWAVQNDWNVVRFWNGIERAVDVESAKRRYVANRD